MNYILDTLERLFNTYIDEINQGHLTSEVRPNEDKGVPSDERNEIEEWCSDFRLDFRTTSSTKILSFGIRQEYRIPDLHPTYVHRDDVERRILSWIMTARHPSCFCIRSHRGAGKTVLAVNMAWEASRRGFDVLWIPNGGCEMTREKLEIILAEVGEPLFFVDNISHKSVLDVFRESHKLIVTSNDLEFGNDTDGFYVESASLSGLTNKQSENLLINVLNQSCRKFQKNDSLWLFTDLCSNYDNQPLFVSILGSFMLKDYGRWSSDFDSAAEYVSELESSLSESQSAILNMKSIDVRCEQECYTYSIILLSMQRLSSYYQEIFQRLVLHSRDEMFLPVTLTVLWDVNKDAVILYLRKLCKRQLLIQQGYNPRLCQYEYKMQSLVFEVLREWVGSQGKYVIANQIVRFYVTHKNIHRFDETFYRRFVSWCLAADQIDVALKVVCDPQYLSTRIRLGYSDGLLSDLETLCNCADSHLLVTSHRDSILKCFEDKMGNNEIAEKLMQRPISKPGGDIQITTGDESTELDSS